MMNQRVLVLSVLFLAVIGQSSFTDKTKAQTYSFACANGGPHRNCDVLCVKGIMKQYFPGDVMGYGGMPMFMTILVIAFDEGKCKIGDFYYFTDQTHSQPWFIRCNYEWPGWKSTPDCAQYGCWAKETDLFGGVRILEVSGRCQCQYSYKVSYARTTFSCEECHYVSY